MKHHFSPFFHIVCKDSTFNKIDENTFFVPTPRVDLKYILNVLHNPMKTQKMNWLHNQFQKTAEFLNTHFQSGLKKIHHDLPAIHINIQYVSMFAIQLRT